MKILKIVMSDLVLVMVVSVCVVFAFLLTVAEIMGNQMTRLRNFFAYKK